MTVWYNSTENNIVESGDKSYIETTDDGFILNVDEMSPNKLNNIKHAVDQAVENNDG